MNKIRIKKGDTVKVISGKDKGKTGKVIQVLPRLNKAVVENVNLHTKFQKSRQAGQPGTKVITPSPMPVSKLQIIDASSGSPSRIGYVYLENGNKQRVAKVSGKAV